MNYDQSPSAEDARFIPDETGTEVVPPIYRVGEDSRNEEIIDEGNRILTWELEGNETQIAEIAGWDGLEHKFDDKSGYILLPAGTRNARSALSGMEAWADEKSAIVSAAAGYLERVKDETGRTDYSFKWSSVGVTPEHEVFIAPPNLVAPTTAEKGVWKGEVVEELTLLLQNDERNRGLADEFAEKIVNL